MWLCSYLWAGGGGGEEGILLAQGETADTKGMLMRLADGEGRLGRRCSSDLPALFVQSLGELLSVVLHLSHLV